MPRHTPRQEQAAATQASLTGIRIAVVHYWLNEIRGGEKVFFELARAFPEADLYVLHGDVSRLPEDLRSRKWTESFVGRPPFRGMPYRSMLPLLPMAAHSLDLRGYGLVISSSAGWAHGVRTADSTCHVTYMHSPPRYLWGGASPVGGPMVSALIAPVLRGLRTWDARAAHRVDAFAANSLATAQKVRSSYGRASRVIYPPVDVEAFSGERSRANRDYAIAAGELVPYKRFDLAIAACAIADLPLLVVGDGPQRRQLGRLAGELKANVQFAGRVTSSDFRRHIMDARVFVHAGVEDFGITTVEALAAGVPVVGARTGGTGEIVTDETGILVDDPTPASLANALTEAWTREFDVPALRRRAANYRPELFRARVREFAAAELAERFALGADRVRSKRDRRNH